MNPYASIETVFERDKETHVLDFGALRMKETSCIMDWSVSEKIDGTNIRATYHFVHDGDLSYPMVDIKGRTDNAQMPPGLVDAVLSVLPPPQRAVDYFTEYRGKELPAEWSVTFYGEGYGPGIQKGGVYANEKRFRVFDLKLGEHLWTDDGEMRRVCRDLAIPTAPFLGWLNYIPTTREDITNLFPLGSIVALEDRHDPDVEPEGIVAKPAVVLLDKHGRRVMWKLTLREFKDELPPHAGKVIEARRFETYPGTAAIIPGYPITVAVS